MEDLKQEHVRLAEEKDGLEVRNQKLAEEASYAKELANAAALELRNLAEEVTKLSYENAKLTGELAAMKEVCCGSCQRYSSFDFKQNSINSARSDGRSEKPVDGVLVEELRKELSSRREREAALELKLSERDQIEGDLRRRLDEAKQHEEDLENELAKMWVLVAKFRKLSNSDDDVADHVSENSHARFRNVFLSSNGHCNVSKNDESCKSMNKTGVIHV